MDLTLNEYSRFVVFGMSHSLLINGTPVNFLSDAIFYNHTTAYYLSFSPDWLDYFRRQHNTDYALLWHNLFQQIIPSKISSYPLFTLKHRITYLAEFGSFKRGTDTMDVNSNTKPNRKIKKYCRFLSTNV